MSDNLLADAAAELFARHATPDAVRAIRRGGDASALWGEIEQSGFLDALVPEERGGAGLTPAEVLPVLFSVGRHAVPLPVGETMLVRAAFAAAGDTAPEGAIALAQPITAGARLRVRDGVAAHARWVLLPTPDAALLLPAEGAPEWSENSNAPRLPAADWLAAGAWLTLARMAGALERMLEDTVRYAGERRQFGRPVAGFQAVQQQASVLTEDVFAACIAAQLASIPAADGQGTVAGLDPLRIAAGKARIGEAAARAAAIAHGVYGAMGITEEVDLHLLTAQLRDGRPAFGSESHWAAKLGRAMLSSGAPDSLSFVRDRLGPA